MALATVDPKTGHVPALVGGRDFARSQVNLALGNCNAVRQPDADGPVCVNGGGGGRQPGSSFKPITLARAFEEGIGPGTVYRGPRTYTFPRCSGRPDCTVKNVESGSHGRLTLTDATAYSVNTVYAQLVQDVGVEDTAEMAHRLGLTMINPDGKHRNGNPYGPSLTLGAAEVSPLDMAAAFGVFANRGDQQPATPILRILGPDGTVLEDNRDRRPERVLPTAVADQVNDVLAGVVRRGTGRAADIGRPNGTAGKTGTRPRRGRASRILADDSRSSVLTTASLSICEASLRGSSSRCWCSSRPSLSAATTFPHTASRVLPTGCARTPCLRCLPSPTPISRTGRESSPAP